MRFAHRTEPCVRIPFPGIDLTGSLRASSIETHVRFHNQGLLDKLPNADYDAAHQMLSQVKALYEDAGLQFAKFGNEIGHVSLQRMNFGLKYSIDEDASMVRINPQMQE
jgi:hypothetical protein